MAKKKNKFYAYCVDSENLKGISNTWDECKTIVAGKKARYKGFPTDTEAKSWLNSGANYEEKKDKFYAYFIESENLKGVINSWTDCKKIIADKKARYKSFTTEMDAKKWLDLGAKYETKADIQASLEDGIYFDAGTGRGQGTEVKVTDKFGKSLLHKVISEDKISKYETYFTKEGSSNNFGELLGSYIALKVALQGDERKIFGDSKLVIEYWSKGIIKRDKVAKDTVDLADKVSKLRKEYELLGGIIKHVSGDINPADLGFHK